MLDISFLAQPLEPSAMMSMENELSGFGHQPQLSLDDIRLTQDDDYSK